MKTNVEKILDYVESNGPTRYKDILRYFVEVIRGERFNYNTCRGYLSHAMCLGAGFFPLGYFLASVSTRRRHLHRVSRGIYTVITD